MRRPEAVLRPAAAKEIDEIADYIAKDNPKAAARFYREVGRALDLLAAFPAIGSLHPVRKKQLEGLRSWPISGFRNYVIFFLPIGRAGVDVVHVLHGKRDVDQILDET